MIIKKYAILFLPFVLFQNAFSQEINKISFESGAVINSQIDPKNNFSTSQGYFLKCVYEAQMSVKNNWSFLMPLGISFLAQNGKYNLQGNSAAANSFTTKKISDRNIDFFFGSSVQYQNSRCRFAESLFLNGCLTVNFKEGQSSEYRKDVNIYLSSQFSTLFKLGKNIWMGPACEVFFYNLGHSFQRKTTNKNTLSDAASYSINMAGKNVWINPGIKVQIDIK